MDKEMFEILWHGRGGQGAKTAATMVAHAAMDEGQYSQGFPEYGPERMGAPIKGYTRISKKPITVHCSITRPEAVVVLDSSLLEAVDITQGTDEDKIRRLDALRSRGVTIGRRVRPLLPQTVDHNL